MAKQWLKMDSYSDMKDNNWLANIGKMISSESSESASWLHLTVYDKIMKHWPMYNHNLDRI